MKLELQRKNTKKVVIQRMVTRSESSLTEANDSKKNTEEAKKNIKIMKKTIENFYLL